jgi:superfamily II DNA or RNA helicase
LVTNKLWQEFIDKIEDKALDELSESDFVSLLLASKTTNNFELTVRLHGHKKISDSSLLARCAAELINIGKVDEGMNLYNEVKDQEPTGKFKLPITRLFLSKLNGHGLINYDKIEKIEKPFYLEKIAKHLVAALAPLKEINHYLERAIELKDSSAASLFVEINIDSTIDRQVLELAASAVDDSIAKRELAKVLIKEDRREEALQLAIVAAESDDQAAHLLIYVLNENVAEWAYKLYERDSEYSPEVYRKQFLSQGIALTPRYSALDNLELHRLVREGAPKQSRISKASQSRVEESWFCREAIGRFEGSGSWKTLSCNNHRERTCEFHAEKMFPEVGDISWAISTEAIISESLPLTIENKPNLAKLLGRREPRAWQKEAFNAWVSHGRHGIVEAATGSGKSMLGVMAALEAMDEGYAVVIVVPTRVLQQQWIKQYFLTLWDAPGAKIRTIGNTDGDYVRNAGQITPGTITVAVAKSLRENPAFNPAHGVKSLIIADEVHNYTSEASQEMLSSSYTRRLGLTATLEPPQGRYPVLANFFGGDPIYRYDFTRAVRDKVISPYNLVTIGVPLEKEIARLYTAAYIRMKNAKDQLLMLGNIVNNPDSLNRTIEIFHSKGLHSALIKEYESAFEESDNYLKDANSKAGAIRLVTDFIKTRGNTIVFSDLVATARNIQIIFKQRGLDSEVISAEVPQSERESIFRKLKNKTISALLSPKALDEGVDIEQLSTGVFAGASRRRLQIIQRLGRVLRISENKQMPLLILIVADGTEEDPCMPNNESMQNSPFGIVYDQAVSKKHFKLEDDTEIRRYLLGLANN